MEGYWTDKVRSSFIDTFQIGEIANAFLIPALESENAENQNYGEVPYWTAQHSPFNELPAIWTRFL